MMTLKVKQSFTLSVYFLKYILGAKAWIFLGFLNETLMLVFAGLQSFFLIK